MRGSLENIFIACDRELGVRLRNFERVRFEPVGVRFGVQLSSFIALHLHLLPQFPRHLPPSSLLRFRPASLF